MLDDCFSTVIYIFPAVIKHSAGVIFFEGQSLEGTLFFLQPYAPCSRARRNKSLIVVDRKNETSSRKVRHRRLNFLNSPKR